MLEDKRARIVLDLTGGDRGYEPNLEALKLLECDSKNDFELICVGDPEIWDNSSSFELIRPGGKDPVRFGLELVKENYADAFVSAGDTGHIVSNAAFILGKMENISRPALLALVPTIHREPAVLIDVGATPRATSKNLVDFALMGLAYAENVLGWKNPKVALLSIGEENHKGTQEIKEANSILRETLPNFIGNAEGKDIIASSCSIFVCDGYTGNILLKFAESMKKFLRFIYGRASSKDIRAKIGGLLLEPYLKMLLKDFDYANYGGAPLLGVKGACIIGHGRSSPLAIKNAVLLAVKVVNSEVLEKMRGLQF